MIRSMLIACLLLPTPLMAAEAPSRDAIGVMREGVNAYMGARFDEAVQLLSESISMHPQWKTASGFRAICLWTTGDLDGARADAKIATRMRPNSAESYTARGFANFVLRDLEAASDDFIAAARRGRNYGPAYFGMGSVMSSRERLRDALKNLDIAVKLEPNSAAIRIVRGTVYEKTREFRRAIGDYSKVLKLAPEFHWARYYRGRTYRELKEYPKAIIDLSAFLKHNPDYEKALYFRSNAYFLSGDFENAVNDLSRLVVLNPKHGLAYANRGVARYELGDKTGALADLEAAKGLLPEKAKKIQAQIESFRSEPLEEDLSESPPLKGAAPVPPPPVRPNDIPIEPLPDELPEDKPRFSVQTEEPKKKKKDRGNPAKFPGQVQPDTEDEEGGDFMFIR